MQPRPAIAYKKFDVEVFNSKQGTRHPLNDREVYAWAIRVLQTLDGLTHAEIRHVLRQTDVVLNNATILDCSSSDFQEVLKEYCPA